MELSRPYGNPDIPLFPHLTKLRWTQEVSGSTDIFHLLSPSLRSLHLIFRRSPSSANRLCDRSSGHQEFIDTLLKTIAEKAPLLSYLRITRKDGIPEAWSFSLSRFQHLETVDVLDPVYGSLTTPVLLPDLVSLRQIRTLRLRLPTAFCGYLEVCALAAVLTRTRVLTHLCATGRDGVSQECHISSPSFPPSGGLRMPDYYNP